jgi:hypothetical protein
MGEFESLGVFWAFILHASLAALVLFACGMVMALAMWKIDRRWPPPTLDPATLARLQAEAEARAKERAVREWRDWDRRTNGGRHCPLSYDGNPGGCQGHCSCMPRSR